MDTEILFERVCEELDLVNENKAVILFGSRTRDDYTESSDLDIFVINYDLGFSNNRVGIMIDDIPVEIIYISQLTLFRCIQENYYENITFYESVFYTGLVKKDSYGLIPLYKNYIESLKENNKLDDTKLYDIWEEGISKEYGNYLNHNGNYKKYYYYDLIEILRIIYHGMHNYSVIYTTKVYDMYVNPEKAEESYKLNLPPKDFRDTFVEALSANNMDESLKKLFAYVGYKGSPIMIEEEVDEEFFDDEDVKSSLVHLGKLIFKVESMLLSNHPSKDFLYFNLLGGLEEKCFLFAKEDMFKFKEMFMKALDLVESTERINILEEMFELVNSKYNIDYKNYSL